MLIRRLLREGRAVLEARAHCLTHEHPGVFKARTREAAELLLGPRCSRLLLGSFGSSLSTIPLPPLGDRALAASLCVSSSFRSRTDPGGRQVGPWKAPE